MKNKRFCVWISCFLLAVLLVSGCTVAAAEELLEDQVELYTEGGFPNDPPVLVESFGLDDFDEYMIGKLNAQEESINVKSFGLSFQEFRDAYEGLLNAHPELFFVSGRYYYYPGSYMTYIIPVYKYSGAELTNMQAVYESGVKDVLHYASSAKTDIGRMLRANDYICANYEYDLTYTISSPELFFKNGKGVCQAYMLAYRAVLNELGIPNITVTSDEMDHTWNMVYLDGSWYHIDVTWNDPVYDVPLRALHNNFLLSDAGVAANGHYSWNDGWEELVSATSTKYDHYFWTGLNQVASMNGDVVYYADSDYTTFARDVYAFDLSNGTNKKVHTYDYGYGSYYKGYNPIWVEGGKLYYAVRNALYSVPLSGGTAELVYTARSSQWIWYPYQCGRQLKMYVSSSPQSYGSTEKITLDINIELTLDQNLLQMEIGSEARLIADLAPASLDITDLKWISSNPEIAAVDSSGHVKALSEGVAEITVRYDDSTSAVCTAVVFPAEKLYLPACVDIIDENAFSGIEAGMIVIPDEVSVIASRAFADNEALLFVKLPSGEVNIAADAFSGSKNVMLICAANSDAAAYAAANNIPYVIAEE